MESRKKQHEELASVGTHLGEDPARALQKLQQQTQTSRPGSAERDRKVAARVLARFKAMFPSFGVQLTHDEEMMMLTIDEWARALAGVDVNRIGQAIEQLTKSSAKWPPSLPEFVAMCQGGNDPAHKHFLPAPPPKPADPELAKKSLDALRRLVRR